ncbi:MAG: hypothetical protein WBM97_20945, partial [Sedimenticolaceae bacterium]
MISAILRHNGARRGIAVIGSADSFGQRLNLYFSPFFVTRAPRHGYGGVHGVEGGEGVVDSTSNRL